jgi:DNA replication and repair protein RecF
MSARASFVAEIAASAEQIYERWQATSERIVVRYAPNSGDADFADALAANLDNEVRRRQTLVGPHRDDVRLELDGGPLAAYGSQGQQRTAVLALKVAEYEVMRARAGDAPILLLDDVLSELDAQRAGGFLAALGSFEQAFLTATELPPGFAAPVATFFVRGGHITRAAC